jgi:hypothetical protein
MKVTEIIRGILDLIDDKEKPAHQSYEQPNEDYYNDDVRRFKQIVDLLDQPEGTQEYSNSPNEQYADVDSVTTRAGGGVNGPKHPADIRGDSIRIYGDN